MSLKRAYGTFLAQWPWDHFATLTFSTVPNDERCRGEFKKWIRRMERLDRRRVDYFVAYERGGHGDLLHIHALTLGTGGIPLFGIEAGWRSGRMDARVYEADGGAAYYVAKVVEGSGDYAFSGKLEAARAS